MKFIIIPILLLAILFSLYVGSAWLLGKKSTNATLIYELNWKDGFILICSYSMVKVISPFLGFHNVVKRLFLTLLLYCFSYAIIAFPYWLTSFLQPFQTNVFIHTFFLICFIELPFSKIKRRV
jgi:hypothetical protein